MPTFKCFASLATHTYSIASSRSPEVSWVETAERVGLRLDVYSLLRKDALSNWRSPPRPGELEKTQKTGGYNRHQYHRTCRA